MNNSLIPQENSSLLNGSLETDSKELNRRYFIVGERRFSNYWWASVVFLGGLGFLLTGISSYLKYNLLVGFAQKILDLTTLIHFHPNVPVILLPSQNLNSLEIAFFPQGLLMCFYGSLGLLLSVYWWLLIYWDIGGGFNEFNKKEGFMRIFRWGYPGKNRRIDIVYPLSDIEAIRVEFKQAQGLLAAEQSIYVSLLSSPLTEKKESLVGGVVTSLPLRTLPQKNGAATEKNKKEKREIPLGGIGQPLTLKEIEKQASELANFLQVALVGL